MSTASDTTQVYRVYIRATPAAIWDAITRPEWTERYGYQGRAEFDPAVQAGAAYRVYSDEQMPAAGMPAVVLQGEVLEADPPRRLSLTWQAMWEPVEGPTTLTYEIVPGEGGVTSLTVTHELAEAPGVAAMVAGKLEPEGAGGGWAQVLSDLKSLLETGRSLYG